MSTRDAGAARRALAIQLSVGLISQVTLILVGFALLGYFLRHGLPSGYTMKENADDLFPWFISHGLPPGVSGLVLAAMFAAAMSSIDSGVNSITAVVTTDFLDRFGKKPETEKGQMRIAQLVALIVGATVVLCSSFVKYIPGNIIEVTNKVVNLLTVPIFLLFFF